MQGIIVHLILDRGFGFLQSAQHRRRLFFHCKSLRGMEFDELLLQRDVEFDVEEDQHGRTQAVNVRPVTVQFAADVG